MNESRETQPLATLLFTEPACDVEFGEYDDENDIGHVEAQVVLSPVKNNREN